MDVENMAISVWISRIENVPSVYNLVMNADFMTYESAVTYISESGGRGRPISRSSITLECDGENDDPRIPFDVHKELYILRLSSFEEIRKKAERDKSNKIKETYKVALCFYNFDITFEGKAKKDMDQNYVIRDIKINISVKKSGGYTIASLESAVPLLLCPQPLNMGPNLSTAILTPQASNNMASMSTLDDNLGQSQSYSTFVNSRFPPDDTNRVNPNWMQPAQMTHQNQQSIGHNFFLANALYSNYDPRIALTQQGPPNIYNLNADSRSDASSSLMTFSRSNQMRTSLASNFGNQVSPRDPHLSAYPHFLSDPYPQTGVNGYGYKINF